MNRLTHPAELYLDRVHVGSVRVHDWHGAWGFGQFTPNDAFAPYAPMYERWAQLMREVQTTPRLTNEMSSKLRDAEYALYGVDSELHVPAMNRWHHLGLLNIDGTSIEWKESGVPRIGPARELVLAGKMAS